MARYLDIPREVVPFYLKVRGEIPILLRTLHLLTAYHGHGYEAQRQLERLRECLNAIEAHIAEYDECCDGTLYQETRLILRLVSAMDTDVSPRYDTGDTERTYRERAIASVQRIRVAVAEVRELANLDVCDRCGEVVRDCDCDRCEYCNALSDECECDICEHCGRPEDFCYCDRCEYCGDKVQDCECPRCRWCGEREQDCECEVCDGCERNTHECVCELNAVNAGQQYLPF